MSDVAIVQIVTVVTLVAGFMFQWFRENRNRKWDLEDRAAKAREIVSKAEEVAVKAEETKHEVIAAVVQQAALAQDMERKLALLHARINQIGRHDDGSKRGVL